MSMTDLTNEEVLRLWATVMGELRRRRVIRSANNPVADYAETLVAERLGLQLVGNSTASYDAVAQDGTRYQIKARRLHDETSSRQLSAIRNLDQGGFDHLVIVLFDEDFGLKEIWRLPIDLVREHAVYRRHVNAHILHARGSVLSDPRAEQLHPSSQELGDPPCSSPFEQVVEQEAIVANSLPTGLISDLERHEIEPPLDLAGMLDIVFRRGFGYALQGSPWRRPFPHEANVYRQGRSMTKRTGRTPAEALARALVDALDAEARLPGDQIVTGDG